MNCLSNPPFLSLTFRLTRKTTGIFFKAFFWNFRTIFFADGRSFKKIVVQLHPFHKCVFFEWNLDGKIDNCTNWETWIGVWRWLTFFSAFGNFGPPWSWSKEQSELFLFSKNIEVCNTFGGGFAGNDQVSGYKEVNISVSRLIETKSMFGSYDFQ